MKFFLEPNVAKRILSLDKEERLIRNAAPFLQDLIRFDLNTGLRTGELFSLRWFNVDMEEGVLNVFSPKTQKSRAVPINAEARKILEAWALHRKNEFVFYNHDTGKPFVDLKAGFALACKKAGITDVAQTSSHVCFPAAQSRCGHRDGPAVAFAFNRGGHHALHSHKSRYEESSSRKAGRTP